MVDRGARLCTRGWIGRLAIAAGLLLASQLVAPAPAAADAPNDAAPNRATCHYAATHPVAQVHEPAIREASALVASQQFPGIYWTLNDSGNAPVIFAFDQDGTPRGSFRVSGATNVDWEAMQLGPDGDGGYALYIGDIGDNNAIRRDPVIYRVPEPEPAPAASQATAETAPATVFRFELPGRSHNAEAMLVDPTSGAITLVTREVSGVSMIYRLPQPLDPGNVVTADFVDVVDLRTFGLGSSPVTDATISPDGQYVALRTYNAVVIYDTRNAATPDQIWEQTPAVIPLADGPKGEGITYKLGTDDLMTIGEGTPAELHETDLQC